MEEIKKPILTEENAAPEEEMKLDDARRVKVLSPGMLVFKRFIRNKLAIAGTIILVIMFTFAFLGPVFTPYRIAQQFTDTNALQWSEYATVMYNNELRYTIEQGKSFSKADQTALMLAFSNYKKAHGNQDLAPGETLEFTSGSNTYYVQVLNPEVPSYVIRAKEDLATVSGGKVTILSEAYADDEALKAELLKRSGPLSPTSGEMEYEGKRVSISGSKMERKFVMIGDPFVLASQNVFDSVNAAYADISRNMSFCTLLEEAMRDDLSAVTFEEKTFTLEEKGADLIVRDDQGADVMTVSELIFGTARNGVVLTVPFKEATQEAIRAKVEYFQYPDENGQMKVGGHIDQAVSDLCIVGDSLYFYGSQWSEVSMSNTITYGIINVKTHQVVSTSLSSAPEISKIRMPYGIIVNPVHRDFYLMDAKNYVSSGELLHFLPDGTFDWKVKTGDIPAHAAFLFKSKKVKK